MSGPAPESERLSISVRDLRRRLAITFERTADALETSARLAEEEAARQAHQGQRDQHAVESTHAQRAHRAAAQARTAASHFARQAAGDLREAPAEPS